MSDLALIGTAVAVQAVVIARVSMAIWRSQPRTLEGWINETLAASLRVPATGALYAAGVLTYVWIKART